MNHSAPSGPRVIPPGLDPRVRPALNRVSSGGRKRVITSGPPPSPSTVIHSAPSGPPTSDVGSPYASAYVVSRPVGATRSNRLPPRASIVHSTPEALAIPYGLALCGKPPSPPMAGYV